MSRNLPPQPNLEHLKKQAKDLLHDLQQQNPSLKLADAQHALARDYGFSSWPKLKSYVESVSNRLASAEAVQPYTLSQSEVNAKKENPFVGKWTANLLKSRRHPSSQFQRATLEVAMEGNQLTISDVVVDDAGRENSGRNTILVDGNEYPSENGNGYVLVARWRGPQVIETIAKKNGQSAGWGTYEVSEDGQTMTISGAEQMIVLDRN